ncbi:hypothetical protein RSJ21_11955 [Clostridium botulinum]|uniref:Uncharacterized protein n=4 Tax=Clostridium TaxID=1485 RepID=A0A0M0A3U9_CLOBO|nr:MULTISPECIES: hypothetical protein [Clostridium]EKX79874.1 hypothetical protein CFSAN001628_010218 [Clostridium botulinum CFSAN001628]NFK35000.1 hypothetical protein [Clostridium botulinum H04402 065]ABS33697.1 hypothetical protein CLB_2175 [Clostridium botulinum A str. ATCC 19397]ABS38079.1 hypothetical protein CLC_2158 [Clostridium botulinum A str. Hall]ABS40256.1 hypothetical protein CLI_2284 [Clostridium botulinum F str. Langeland]
MKKVVGLLKKLKKKDVKEKNYNEIQNLSKEVLDLNTLLNNNILF